MPTPSMLAASCAPEPAAPPDALQRVRFTPEMFYQLGALGVLDERQRYELIEGDIYPMPPESPEHAAIGADIAHQWTQRGATAWHIRAEKPLRIGESELIPDIAVVQGRPRDYLSSHPTSALLVIEIANTSLPRDRALKLRLYAQANIPEYWIVNLAERRLEVYREPANAHYKSLRYYALDETICPLFEPEWQIPVRELFGGAER